MACSCRTTWRVLVARGVLGASRVMVAAGGIVLKAIGGGVPQRVAAERDAGVAAGDGSRDNVSLPDQSRAQEKGTLIEMIISCMIMMR